MILVIGEILFDIFPGYKRLGGAPFNFAFHLKKIGMPVAFISRVGNDNDGNKILDFLDSCGFDLENIQIDPLHKTGRVIINIDENGYHNFNIIKNVAYDYIEYNNHLDFLLKDHAKFIYFGSLIQRTPNGFNTLQRILSRKHGSIKKFCDINLRPGCWTTSLVQSCLQQSDILKLSHEELFDIIPPQYKIHGTSRSQYNIHGGSNSQLKNESLLRTGCYGDFCMKNNSYSDIIDYLMHEYELEAVILTLGKDGSHWFTREHHHKVGPVNISLMKDTVGAGDAYAAMAAACYLKGLNIEETMSLASAFASRICMIKGALPDSDEIYSEFKEKIGG